MAMFLDPDWTSANTLNLFTGASGTSGYGAYFNGSWFRGSWLLHQRLGERSIQWQELFAIVAAAKVWGPHLAKHHVRFHCDNQAIVYAWSGQSSKDVAIMTLLTELFFTAPHHNFSVQLVHLPGQHNPLADALSHNILSRFSPLPHRLSCIPPQTRVGRPLEHILKRLACKVMAPFTSFTYGVGFRWFRSFCRQQGAVPMPASRHVVALHILANPPAGGPSGCTCLLSPTSTILTASVALLLITPPCSWCYEVLSCNSPESSQDVIGLLRFRSSKNG